MAKSNNFSCANWR